MHPAEIRSGTPAGIRKAEEPVLGDTSRLWLAAEPRILAQRKAWLGLRGDAVRYESVVLIHTMRSFRSEQHNEGQRAVVFNMHAAACLPKRLSSPNKFYTVAGAAHF